MAHYARRYQLRVHQRGTIDPTDATVDFVLESEIQDRPTIPGPVARPLDGKTETQAWTLPVVDAEGVIVSRLGDPGGKMHQLGRLAEFREHDGISWATIYTGRIAGLSEPEPGKWNVRLADERWYERQAELFLRADTTMVWPAGMRYVWRRGGAFRSGWTFTVDTLPDPGMRVLRLTTLQPGRVDSGAPEWVRPGIELVHDDVVDQPHVSMSATQGNFRTLRLRLDGVDHEIVSFDSTTLLRLVPRQYYHVPGTNLHESLEEGRPLDSVWVVWPEGAPIPAQGATFTGYIYAPEHEPTEALPLHIGVEDPSHEWGAASKGLPVFEAVRRAYDKTGVRYSPDHFAALIADSYALAAWRVKGKQKVAEWTERYVYKPTLVMPFVDNLGRLAPRPLTPPAGMVLDDLFVFDASNTKAPYPTWDHQDGEMVNVVEAVYEAEYLERDDPPSLDRIKTEARHREPMRHSTVIDGLAPERPITIDLSGWQDGPAPGPVRDPITGILIEWPGLESGAIAFAQLRHGLHILDRFGDGPITQVVYGTEDTREVQAGDWVLIDQDSLRGPNPATNARSGKRLVQIMKRDILPVGYRYEVLDAGPALQPLATPTLSLALDGADPRHAVTATVGSVDANAERVVVQFAYNSAFTEIVQEIELDGAGSRTIRPLASGVQVFARAQARAAMRVASLWSAVSTVSTTALSAPTGLAATVSGRTIRLDFTPAHGDYALVPTLNGQPAIPSPLPAGSTSYIFAGLDEATQYTVGVRHVDPWGGMSPIASLTRTTGASTELAAPRRMRVLQGRADPAQPSNPLFGHFSLLSIGLEVGFVAPERYADHRVQVATDPTFAETELLYETVVPAGRETVRLRTPMITDRLFVRARAEREGFEDSEWSDIVSAYATTLLARPPASDHFPGGWADLRIDSDGDVVITLGSDDPDTDRIYYAASTTDFPDVDSSSSYVARADLPAIVLPPITVDPDDTVFATVRFWNAVSGFGQGLRLSRAWAEGPPGPPGPEGPPGPKGDRGDPGPSRPTCSVVMVDHDTLHGSFRVTGADWQGGTTGLQFQYIVHLRSQTPPEWPATWTDLDAQGRSGLININAHERYDTVIRARVRDAGGLISDPDDNGLPATMPGVDPETGLIDGTKPVGGAHDPDLPPPVAMMSLDSLLWQGIEPPQNLLPAGSGAAVDVPTGATRYPGATAATRDIPLSALGLAVDDVVSYSVSRRVTGAGGVARSGVGWVDSSGEVIRYDNVPDYSGTTEARGVVEGVTIPPGTVAARPYFGERGTGTAHFRLPMFRRGPIASSYEAPPLRPERGDEGRAYHSFKTQGILNRAAMADGTAANVLVTAGLTITKWHGDEVDFEEEGAKFNDPPAVHPGIGGLTMVPTGVLDPPYGPVVRIINLTAAGFKVEARLEELVGTTTPSSATFRERTAFDPPGPDWLANKTTAGEAWDNTYLYTYSVTVDPNSAVVAEAWVFDGASWVLAGTKRWFNDDPVNPVTFSGQTIPVTWSGLSGTGDRFGMSVRAELGDGRITAVKVDWQEGVAPGFVEMTQGASMPIHFLVVGR